MSPGIVRDGRLSWPLFWLAVYASVLVLAFDVAWRLVEVRFVVLAGGFAIAALAGAVPLLVCWRRGAPSRTTR